MSSVYRIHIRPSGGSANPTAAFKYCLEHQVLGLGWALPDPRGRSLSWEEYVQAATAEYGSRKELSRVRYLHDRLRKDDLLWTRDLDGSYYLARVTGPWRYDDDQAAKEADMVNVVPCEIHKVGLVDEVPGKVVACFRPTRTVQAIADSTAQWYSQLTWNRLASRQHFAVDVAKPDLFALIGDRALEDLVLLQLQTQGWLVLSSSREKDTLAYETVLVNPASLMRAVVQVKSGNEQLAPSRWAEHDGQVFLFQANDRYVGEFPPNVSPIDADGLRRFAYENPKLLPGQVTHWMAYLSHDHHTESTEEVR